MLEVLIEYLNPVSGAQSDMRSEHPDPRSLAHRTVSPACGGWGSSPECVRPEDGGHSSADSAPWIASRLQRSHTEPTSRIRKPTRHGRRTVRIGRRPAKTSVSLPPIRPFPENQRSSRLRATRATRVVFEVEENASDVSDESEIRPRQSRANCVSQVPVAARRVREFLRDEYTLAFRHEHWHVGIVYAPIHSFLEPDSRPAAHWFPLPYRRTSPPHPF